jgi:PleD family two-component response regulator
MTSSYVGLEVLLVMEEGSKATEIGDLLNQEGFIVSRISAYSTVLDLLENKFFAVALFDLDTPDKNQGLRLLKKCKSLSPVTHTVILSRNKCSANHVIKANNLGCSEFIIMRDLNVSDYLVTRVMSLASQISYEGERDRLLKKVSQIHNKFFKRMMALHIRAMDADENLIAIAGIPDEELPPINLLIVDAEERLINTLKNSLKPDAGWNFSQLFNASEALDQGSSGFFHVAIINKSLPDLPGTMVASTIQASEVKTKSFVFEYTGNSAEIKLFESTGISGDAIKISSEQGGFRPSDAQIVESIENPVDLRSHNDLVSKIRQVRQELAAKVRKSHYAKSFKVQNYDFLQEYGQLRSEIKLALERLEDIPEHGIG